jgi:hypothetical protein
LVDGLCVAQRDVLSDRQWARIFVLLPTEKGAMGRPSRRRLGHW